MKEADELHKESKHLLKLIKRKIADEKCCEIFGFYRFIAKIDALENVLIKKKIITKKEIFQEMIPIIRFMKKDFRK